MAVIDKGAMVILLLCSLLLVSPGCSEQVTKSAGVSLWKGTSSFDRHYSELDNPKGILPTGLDTGSENGAILRISPVNFHEYFVYDEKCVLLVLSYTPFYFMKIESREFRFHLDSEYDQFAANLSLSPSVKVINTTTNYKVVGDSRVALYFSPSEIHFTSSGANRYRIKDANSITSVDLWRLLDASDYGVMFTPRFEDQQLFTDMHAQVQAGKKRLIYTRESALTPKNYSILSGCPINFTFFAGRGLSLTPAILGTESEFFVNRVEMTRDYMFFFSTPPGNSQEKDVKDYLNTRHGIAVQIRGTIDSYTDFLKGEGINFDSGSVYFLSTLMTENSGSPAAVTINWFSTRTLDVWYSLNGNDFTLDTQVNDSYRVLGQTFERGRKVWVRLISPSSGLVVAEDSIILSRAPVEGDLAVTEIMWMGTAGTIKYDADEFIEIKNVSDYYLSLKDLKITVQKTGGSDSPGTESALLAVGTLGSYTLAPGGYFLLIRQSENLFSRDNLNPAAGTYFQKSFSPALGNPSTLSDEFTVRVYNDISLLNLTAYSRSTGFNDSVNLIRKSAVRLIDDTISTSSNDVNINEFTGKTFCSPGYAADGEY